MNTRTHVHLAITVLTALLTAYRCTAVVAGVLTPQTVLTLPYGSGQTEREATVYFVPVHEGGQASGPRYLRIGFDGAIYVMEGGGRRIKGFSRDGTLITAITENDVILYDFVVDSRGRTYACSFGSVRMYDADGVRVGKRFGPGGYSPKIERPSLVGGDRITWQLWREIASEQGGPFNAEIDALFLHADDSLYVRLSNERYNNSLFRFNSAGEFTGRVRGSTVTSGSRACPGTRSGSRCSSTTSAR